MSEVFRSRTMGWIIGIVGFSLLGSVLLSIFADDLFVRRSAGSDAYSNSAIGHRGFIELLRRLDIPVTVSRADSYVKAKENAVLLLLEPRADTLDSLSTNWPSADMEHPYDLVVVLPKWRGVPNPTKPSWIAEATLEPDSTVRAVLEAIWVGGELVRLDSTAALQWTSDFGTTPDLVCPQLVRSQLLNPLVSCPEGVLAGDLHLGYGKMLVISDPDILSNHGLGRSQNALLAVQLLETVRPEGGSVIVDETIHGFGVNRSIWRELFDFPLVLVVLQTILAAVALLWMSMTRFGAPIPLPPIREPGKRFLIENTAQLLSFGKHLPHAAQEYVTLVTQDVARRLHMPASVSVGRRIDWLQEASRNRGMTVDILSVQQEAKDLGRGTTDLGGKVVRMSRELHQWREEMIHGTHRTQRPL